MLYKGYIIGASFSRGATLNYPNRLKNNIPINYFNTSDDELFFNYKNSFGFQLFEKLEMSWPIIINGHFSLFKNLKKLEFNIKQEFNDNFEYLKPKLVLIQLSNPQRNFIFKNEMHPINFETANGFEKSINEALLGKSEKYKNEFRESIELYLNDKTKWERDNAEIIYHSINYFINEMKKLGVIVKIFSYYTDDYSLKLFNKFTNNSFLKIKHNGIEYDNVQDFVEINKLRVIDVLGIDDEHPVYEAHQIVAESFYNDIHKQII